MYPIPTMYRCIWDWLLWLPSQGTTTIFPRYRIWWPHDALKTDEGFNRYGRVLRTDDRSIIVAAFYETLFTCAWKKTTCWSIPCMFHSTCATLHHSTCPCPCAEGYIWHERSSWIPKSLYYRDRFITMNLGVNKSQDGMPRYASDLVRCFFWLTSEHRDKSGNVQMVHVWNALPYATLKMTTCVCLFRLFLTICTGQGIEAKIISCRPVTQNG